MSVKLKLDLTEFQRAMKEYQKATGKDAADILNHFGGDVALRCAGALTKKAPLTKAGVGKYAPGKGKAYEQRLYFAKAASRGIKKGDGAMTGAAKKGYNKARSSTGYHRAGWINAARDLGKNPRSRPVPGLLADKGYGTKARTTALTAFIKNFAEGADVVPEQFGALQKAINIVAKRELQYAQRKLQKTATRYSGKR